MARGYTERQVRRLIEWYMRVKKAWLARHAIVDRRFNPRGKSLENRQRFLRRAKALVQQAVKHSSQNRDIRDVLEGGEVRIPLDGIDEPRLASGIRWCSRPSASREQGVCRRRCAPAVACRAGGSPGTRAKARPRTRFTLFSAVRSSSICSSTTWNCLTLTKRRLAETELEAPRRAGYSISGSPANLGDKPDDAACDDAESGSSSPQSRDDPTLEAEFAEV